MSDFTIAAEPRTEFGKGAARRLRRASKVPAVLYGHGTDPLHLALPGHETMLALKTTNPLITLTLADGSELALPKHVQRDPLRGTIEHVDFLLVRQGERVRVDVGVHVVGEAAPDTLVNAETTSVVVEAEATNLPESIEVSVAGLTAGALIHAGDLELPAGVTLVDEPDVLIVGIQAAPTAAQMEEGLDENQLPADSATETAAE